MQKKISLKKLITIIFLIIAVVLLSKLIIAMSEDTGPTFGVDEEYRELFNTTARSKLTNPVSYTSKKRNPVVIISYENHPIAIYKINTTSDFDLKRIAVNTRGNLYTGGNAYHVANNDGFFDINYIAGEQSKAEQVEIYYKGSSAKIFQNDTLASVILMCKGFSLSYDKGKTIDMYSEVGGIVPELPLSLSFIKRNNAVYLLIVSVNGPKQKLDANLIRDLL